MIKYIAYCRKSTDEKDKQIMSIPQQIAELKAFAQRENLEISEFLTEAETAKIPGRPVFSHLISLIEKGFINEIVSWHPFMSIPQFFYIRLVSPLVFLSV